MKLKKTLEKLRRKPSDLSFNEFENILIKLKFTREKTNAGSHFKWRHHEKKIAFAAPRKNPMKKIYIKELINLIETHFDN